MRKVFIYYLSAFVSGLVVMAVEMSATRLLAPYFGNSLYVWTNVVGLVMLALALGYYFGGRLADRHPHASPYFVMILVSGLWILLIPFFAAQLFPLLLHGFSNLSLVVKWGSFLAVFLLLVPPLFFLGALVPFTVKLVLKKVSEVGSVSGKISTVSTVGSLLGTFLPAFLLLPFLGTSRTFILLGITLLYLAALGLRQWMIFILATLSLAFFWLVPPVYARSDIIHAEDSAYGFLFITENENGVRALHIDNPLGTQSLYDPASPVPDQEYYYSYFGLLPSMVQQPRTVLILGHAGGTFTRLFNAYYPELEITGVELDPAVTRIAEDFMGLQEADVTVVHADARTFLEDTQESYDLILMDTYHVANIPSHLATQEFFDLIALHLNPRGVFALNAAAEESALLDTLKNTVAASFSSAAVLEIPSSYNSMILGAQGTAFEVSSVPEALAFQEEYFSKKLQYFSYVPEAAVFMDDKSFQVDLLTEEMSLDLLEHFTLD